MKFSPCPCLSFRCANNRGYLIAMLASLRLHLNLWWEQFSSWFFLFEFYRVPGQIHLILQIQRGCLLCSWKLMSGKLTEDCWKWERKLHLDPVENCKSNNILYFSEVYMMGQKCTCIDMLLLLLFIVTGTMAATWIRMLRLKLLDLII